MPTTAHYQQQSNKQAFIYKKNPISTAKAITRKMRQSQLPSGNPPTIENQQFSAHEARDSTVGKPNNNNMMDATRSS